MPTLKKSLSRRPMLDEDQAKWFIDGTDHCFFWEEAERKRDWRAMRDELLADWIKAHPGTRPFAWW